MYNYGKRHEGLLFMSGKRRRKARQKAKRIKCMKSGKNVPFVLANSTRKYPGIKDRYCYQSNIHNLIYKEAAFQNVKYQNSIITKCNFRKAKLAGVDFCHSNLKGCNFEGAILNNVVFMNCNLKNTKWNGAKLQNVYFISTNVSVCNDLAMTETTYILRTYPSNPEIRGQQDIFCKLASHNAFYKYHVLHVTKEKPNYWIIKILFDCYGIDLWRALYALTKRSDKRGFYTLYSYKKFVEKYLKIC